MKIEVWSDFTCPFCYLGKRKLEVALEKSIMDEEVNIEYKSYELEPNRALEMDSSYFEVVANKYGMTITEAQKDATHLIKQAEELGLVYRFETMKPTNTFDAHRLVKFAYDQQIGNEMVERILKAYFAESAHIGKHQTLIKLASEMGLNKNEVYQLLVENHYENAVRSDEALAEQIGVSGVPFFVFNEKYAIGSVSTPDDFIDVFRMVREEEEKEAIRSKTKGKAKTTYCCDGNCEE